MNRCIGRSARLFGIALACWCAAAPQWPQFHGPRRDNISTETGLLKKWPEGGPRLLWTYQGLGHGFSTVAISGDTIYTTGNIGRETVITALNLDGTLKWRVSNGPAYKRSIPGTRSTPTIEGGRLYHENADGDVVCLDAQTGKRIWHVNILERFDGRNITWGLAESLLVAGDKVICTPGGEDIGLVALDKTTGKTLWVCRGTRDKPGYCSPILFQFKGKKLIATLLARSVVCVDAESGVLQWSVPHKTPYDENIMTPIYHDGSLLVSTRTTGTRLLRLLLQGDKVGVEELWHTTDMDIQHEHAVLLNGYVYGACHSAAGVPWACLEWKTGKRTYGGEGIGRASLTCAGGRLYLVNHKGKVALVEPDPARFLLISQFRIPKKGRGPVWAHPVVCGGRLYIRHSDFLYCYDVKER